MCQRNHWPKHKKVCKQRAAELRDEALFKDPPAKEDCPICFLPMPVRILSCISLPPATLTSVPINDFAIANEDLASMFMGQYYSCCGKSICVGCVHSVNQTGNIGKCPFCNSDRRGKTDEEDVEDLMKRVAAIDADAMYILGDIYLSGLKGVQQDKTKATELFTKAIELGCSKAHYLLAEVYYEGRIMKKAKFHYEAAAMAGHEVARYNIGTLEVNSGNGERGFNERAIKHWTIAASAGHFGAMNKLITFFEECKNAMHQLRESFEKDWVSSESIYKTLAAYNNSCVEMRSEARDNYIRVMSETGET
jgi:TPR repeat protein